MLSLSPGIAQGCFALLKLVGSHRVTSSEAAASFPPIAGVAAETIIKTARGLHWVEPDESGYLCVTASGERISSLSDYERMLRQALLDYIDCERPPWVQDAQFGRGRVTAFVRSEIAQVFVEAGLLDSVANDVVAFWDRLANIARGRRSEQLTLAGRAGERLSLAYEEKRTGTRPKWIAVESNCDGYDVLSIVDTATPSLLSIEVKTSTIGVAGSLHVTRNEWDTALNADAYVFHVWDLIDRTAPRLAIVSVDQMRLHVPADSGSGSWQQFEVPVRTFQHVFEAVVIPGPYQSSNT